MHTSIPSALITRSRIAAIGPPASAFDAREFWKQQDRSRF
jgi:hypothetical protein